MQSSTPASCEHAGALAAIDDQPDLVVIAAVSDVAAAVQARTPDDDVVLLLDLSLGGPGMEALKASRGSTRPRASWP